MRPVLIALLLAGPAAAGVYSPHEEFIFELDDRGVARPIQFGGGFDIILGGVRAIAIEKPGDPPNPFRARVLERIRQLKARDVPNLPPEDLAGYTADLIRAERKVDYHKVESDLIAEALNVLKFGHIVVNLKTETDLRAEALNLLQRLTRDRRRGGFIPYAHLARAHAGRGEWREAADQQGVALRDVDFPDKFAKLTKPQLAWLKRVERDYYLPFLSNRADEARAARGSHQPEDVDPLFPPVAPPRRPTDPARFEGPTGEYKPGSMPEAERKKLPADALAVVQQLVLWHPQDARLYWLLGELYNVDGDFETAAKIMDECSYVMGYRSPILRRHKQILQDASAAQSKVRADEAEKARLAAEQTRAAEATERQQVADAERDYQKRFWWILACGVGLGVVLAYYQFREVVRRFRRS